MLTLIVKQSLNNGTAKTWKLRPDNSVQTFGSSRMADVISISSSTNGIQGLFEYRNGHWWYIDMDMTKSLSNTESPAIQLNHYTQVQLDDCTLQFTPVKKEEDLFHRLEKNDFRSLEKNKKFQLYLVRQNGKVLETKVLPLTRKFKPSLLGQNEQVPFIPSEEWHQTTVGNFEVRQKTVTLEDAEKWSHLSANQLIDEDSKKGVFAFLGVTFLIVTIGIFTPKPQTIQTMATPPRIAQKIIVKTEIKQKRKKSETVKPQPQLVVQESAPLAGEKRANTPSAGGGSKVSKMMKSIAGGRISQLLGKVSAQAARSNNLVLANGVKASAGPSGRALAAVGSIEKSGRDWGSDGNGSGVVISTAGRGGGKSASGMGGLAAGATGTGGVGLIEEEGEITGGLDREIIAQYIKSKLGQILYCYERQLSANPDLFGKVAVKFTIGPSGAVEQQLIGDTTLKNATVEGCILNKVAAWKFPTPEGGTRVLVTYPFLFKSTN